MLSKEFNKKKYYIMLVAVAIAVQSCAPATFEKGRLQVATYSDSTVRFTIADKEVNEILSPSISYFYYHKNGIHHNQGAITGYPLNGVYSVYDTNNNLICKGNFKNGVKVGDWLRWDSRGYLYSITTYKNGKISKGKLPKLSTKNGAQVGSTKSDTAKKAKWYHFKWL